MKDNNKEGLLYTLKENMISRTAIFKFKQELLNSESQYKTRSYDKTHKGFLDSGFLMFISLSLLASITVFLTLLFLK